MFEDFGHQHITADNGKPRRRFGRIRFLDQTSHRRPRTVIAVDIKNAVTVRVFSRHFLDRDDIATGLFVDINELP